MSDGLNKENETEKSLALIVEIGRLAHSFGVASGRLENDLERLARATGHEGAFEVSPSAIVFALWRPDDPRQSIHVEKMPGPGFELGKLARLSLILDEAIGGRETMAECRAKLIALKAARPSCPEALVALGYALCGGGFAVVMGLSPQDIAIATTMSLGVYLLGKLGGVWPAFGARFELASAFCVGAFVHLLSVLLSGGNVAPTVIAGLVVLLPGYGLTLGVGELATGQISSGMQRVMAGALTTFKLFVGAYVGTLLASLLVGPANATTGAGLGTLAQWIAVSALVLGMGFVFQMRRTDFLWVLFVGLATYLGMLLGGTLGPWQGSFFGALLLGLTAGLSANWLKRPVTTPIVPGLMILVPGATAVLGLQAMAVDGSAAGLAAELQTLQNIAAILAGLLTARSVVPEASA